MISLRQFDAHLPMQSGKTSQQTVAAVITRKKDRSLKVTELCREQHQWKGDRLHWVKLLPASKVRTKGDINYRILSHLPPIQQSGLLCCNQFTDI